MKIIDGDNFSVYVYIDHPPPHCHVRHGDGSESIIGLPLLNLITGVKFNKKIHNELISNLDTIIEKWEELNPDKHKL
jgi:hypothetical protein